MSGKYGEDNCPSHPFSPSRPCENNRTEDDEQQKNSTKGSNDGDSITNTTKRIQSESDSEVKTISKAPQKFPSLIPETAIPEPFVAPMKEKEHLKQVLTSEIVSKRKPTMFATSTVHEEELAFNHIMSHFDASSANKNEPLADINRSNELIGLPNNMMQQPGAVAVQGPDFSPEMKEEEGQTKQALNPEIASAREPSILATSGSREEELHLIPVQSPLPDLVEGARERFKESRFNTPGGVDRTEPLSGNDGETEPTRLPNDIMQQPGAVAVQGPDFRPEISTMTIMIGADDDGDLTLVDNDSSSNGESTDSGENFIVAAEIAPDIVSAEIVQDEQVAGNRIRQLEDELREARQFPHKDEKEAQEQQHCFNKRFPQGCRIYFIITVVCVVITAIIIFLVTKDSNSASSESKSKSSSAPSPTLVPTSTSTLSPTMTCNLCPEGEFVTNRNHTPGLYNMTCFELEEQRIQCDTQEDSIRNNVADECGCAPACPDGKPFPYPGVVLHRNQTKQVSLTCSELTPGIYSGKLQYGYLAYEKCRCQVSEDFCKKKLLW